MLVVNKTGAAGVVGSNFVKNSKPDGYTLLSARVGCQMGVPAMNKTIPYKWDDFTMLGLIERNPFVLVVNPKSSIKTFADFEKKIKNFRDIEKHDKNQYNTISYLHDKIKYEIPKPILLGYFILNTILKG